MDERQTQIKSGAGLEESRINQDFLNFLNKWSSPVLTVIAVAALVWAGLRYLEQRELERVDRAFGDLHDTLVDGNPAPSSLINIANEYSGVRAVPELAKLSTIDLYLNAYLRGVHPGTEINPATGLPVNEADALDEQQRLSYLDQADTIVREILSKTESDPDKSVVTIAALSRAAAVAESRGEFDTAREDYNKIAALAEANAFPAIKVFAQRRADHLDVLDPAMTLPSQDDVAQLPGDQRPATGAPTNAAIPPEIQAQLDALQEELKRDATSVDVTEPLDDPALPDPTTDPTTEPATDPVPTNTPSDEP